MSVTRIPAALRRQVVERAHQSCEYCLLPGAVAFFAHEVDHVVAEKHGGATEKANLAFTCWRCIRLLQINTEERVRERLRLVASGNYPPSGIEIC